MRHAHAQIAFSKQTVRRGIPQHKHNTCGGASRPAISASFRRLLRGAIGGGETFLTGF